VTWGRKRAEGMKWKGESRKEIGKWREVNGRILFGGRKAGFALLGGITLPRLKTIGDA